VCIESTHTPTYFFFFASYESSPFPWNFAPAKSPSKLLVSHRPLHSILYVATALESGTPSTFMTQSHVPTIALSISCSGPGMGTSCAQRGTASATRQNSAAGVRRVNMMCILCEGRACELKRARPGCISRTHLDYRQARRRWLSRFREDLS